ncbi:hypothetical protein HanPI659440_Chr02g0089811 [Helianthus annuus]|nr:hypothetical protein HanPI659440_Chr02g0089811 [Helianthus annuus]
MLENELKRNLDAVYDVDLCSSQSSTKPRMGDCENNEDPPIYLEDQTINLEGEELLLDSFPYKELLNGFL